MVSRSAILLMVILISSWTGLATIEAQNLDWLKATVSPELVIPVGESAETYNLGAGTRSKVSYEILPLVRPGLGVTLLGMPTSANKTLQLQGLGLGYDALYQIDTRFGINGYVQGGLYQATWDKVQSGGWYWLADLGATYRMLPELSLGLSVGGNYFDMLGKPLLNGLSVSVGLNVSLSGFNRETQNILKTGSKTTALFPVLFGQYDKNSFGEFSFKNNEDSEITNVTVSFYSKQYMERPRETAKIPRLARGEEGKSQLYGVFTADLLKLTESSKILGEVIVEYDYLGVRRNTTFEEEVRVNNRNALSWDDDRKAAAFVSSKDPAVLRYSKYVSGLVRDSLVPGLDQGFQIAVALVQNLKSLDINYVIDPTSAYQDFVEQAEAIDYLQFPFQTIGYRGGDCDDLSILLASMFESVGIESGFITVPGHIYCAFKLAITPEEAVALFPGDSDFIVQDNEVWIPVESTILKEGFRRAWQIGMTQWVQNTQVRKLIPVHKAWSDFAAVGVQSEESRTQLPAPAEVRSTFAKVHQELISYVIDDKVKLLQNEITRGKSEPRLLNRLGVLYARFGQYSNAKTQFETALKAGYNQARVNLANVAFLQRDFASARKSYEEALKSSPEDTIALQGLAKTYYELKLYDLADKTLNQLAKVDPALAAQNAQLKNKATGRQAFLGSGLATEVWK